MSDIFDDLPEDAYGPEFDVYTLESAADRVINMPIDQLAEHRDDLARIVDCLALKLIHIQQKEQRHNERMKGAA